MPVWQPPGGGARRGVDACSHVTLCELMAVDFFAFLQLVSRTAVRTDRTAGLHDLDVDTGMHAPQRGVWTGTINREILCFYVDGLACLDGFLGRTAHFCS